MRGDLKYVSPGLCERRYKLAIDDVQRPLFDIERGLSDSFAQGGVRMSGAADIFGASAEFDH